MFPNNFNCSHYYHGVAMFCRMFQTCAESLIYVESFQFRRKLWHCVGVSKKSANYSNRAMMLRMSRYSQKTYKFRLPFSEILQDNVIKNIHQPIHEFIMLGDQHSATNSWIHHEEPEVHAILAWNDGQHFFPFSEVQVYSLVPMKNQIHALTCARIKRIPRSCARAKTWAVHFKMYDSTGGRGWGESFFQAPYRATVFVFTKSIIASSRKSR